MQENIISGGIWGDRDKTTVVWVGTACALITNTFL